MQEIKDLLIKDPVIVAKDGAAVVFVNRADALETPIDILADAQLYEADRDLFSPILPLGSFGKFMPYLEPVEPPQPFVKPD